MKTSDVVNIMNDMFPLFLQEKYDNAGGQLLFPDDKVSSILLALDLDESVVDEAIDLQCNLIITHHPFFFKPIKVIDETSPRSALLLRLINKRISLYASHTNLDKIYYAKLGESLGFTHTTPLLETDRMDDETLIGFGSVAKIKKAIPLKELLKEVKEKLKLDYLLYSGSLNQRIQRIAVLNGAGGSSIEKILDITEVDCIITGDVGYHHSKSALERGVAVIDAGHYGTERILIIHLLGHLQKKISDEFEDHDVTVNITQKEKNPFQTFS